MNQHNRDIITACQLFQNGHLVQSLSHYQRILNNAKSKILTKFDINQQASIKCTIGVISMALNNYQSALEYFEQTIEISQSYQIDEIVMIRVRVNLIFLDLLQEKYVSAIQKFEEICSIVQRSQNRKHLVSFIYHLLFRVNNLDELNQISNALISYNVSLMEAVALSALIRSKDICQEGLTHQTIFNLQAFCYRNFLNYRRYDLAIASLRHILSLNLLSQQQEQYRKQLNKIVMTGLIDQFEIQNSQIVEAMKQITQRLKKVENNSKISQFKSNFGIVRYSIFFGISKIFMQNLQGQKEEQKMMANAALLIKKQKNQLVLNQLAKSQFAQHSFEEFKFFMERIFGQLQHKISEFKKVCYFDFLSRIKNKLYENSCVSPGRSNRSNNKRNKENIVHGISIVSSKQTSRGIILNSKSQKSSKNNENLSNRSFSSIKQTNDRKIAKMVKLIQHGTFLSKRNFTSDGGQYRFVKITSSLIKWGKSPQKVNQGGQIYPLKDIRGIIYGKVTPTLNKPQNKFLKSHLCFSLILQKRTLDFYCKDYEEVQSWVCGLTVALKKIKQPIVGYTPGKMRWKKMLLILKSNFIDPLAKYQRNNYYYENAYAVIQFGKNKYRLPDKNSHDIRKNGQK